MQLDRPESHRGAERRHRLILLIVGIVLMAHKPPDCQKIVTCYDEKGVTAAFDKDQCQKDMKALSDGAGKWGAALIIIGIVIGFSSAISFLGAIKKTKPWIGVGMAVDIVMAIVSIAMFALCGIIAGAMKIVCESVKKWAADGGSTVADCWKDHIKDVCDWADQFGTASIVFIVGFVVLLLATIVDCSTCCCCEPADAAWKQPQGAKQGAWQGDPVGPGQKPQP